MAQRATRVVILGAGFGGLELSTRLSLELGDRVEVTLIDRNDAFVFGFHKLDVMIGTRTMDDVRLRYAALDKPHVDFRQETVVSIDPDRRHVVTDRGTYDADVLVVALGADLAPERTPGLLECGHEFYSPAGAAEIRDLLPDFRGGSIVIGVLGGFFKCPPAPYEAAFMLHDLLTRRGLREATTLQVVTPMPKPIPISADVSSSILALLDERGIAHSHSSWVERLDPETKTAHLRDGREIAVRPVPRGSRPRRAARGRRVGPHRGRRLDRGRPQHAGDALPGRVRRRRRREHARAARRGDRRG